MAVEDYKKLMAVTDKAEKARAKRYAAVKKLNAKSALRLKTHVKMFKDGIIAITKFEFTQAYRYSEWYERADKIIELQKTMEAAKKAKDATTVNMAKRDILLIHKTATAISKEITAKMNDATATATILVRNTRELMKLK